MNKLLDTAQPSVEFTRRKYVEAHGAIVASAAYTRTLETAAQVLHKVGAISSFLCLALTCSCSNDSCKGSHAQLQIGGGLP